MTISNDPLIVIRLERRAKANAGTDSTGVACEGDIRIHYYPASVASTPPIWSSVARRLPTNHQTRTQANA